MKVKKAIVVLGAVLVLFGCSKDDDAPAAAQNVAPQIENQEFSISEDATEGTVIGTLVATDSDALTYSMTTNDNDLFALTNAGALSLATGKALNYNIAQSHTITVAVSDGTDTTAATITVMVTNVDDVYAVGTEQNSTDIRIPMLWKNGEATVLPSNTANNTFVTGVDVANNGDVYVVGYEQKPTNTTVAILWKNGEATELSNDPTKSSRANGVSIADNGDVYVVGYDQVPVGSSFISATTVWKNNEATYYKDNTPAVGNAIYVSGTDVYVVGAMETSVGTIPVLWENEEFYNLANGNTATTTAIAVSGEDVYITGHQESPNVPLLWKNGEATVLPLGTNSGGGIPRDVYVANNNGVADVYIVGSRGSFSRFWKNNVPESGLNHIVAIHFDTVHVSGNNVYVGGTEYNTTIQKNIATIWKNEEKIALTDGSNNAIVNDVVVK